MTLARLFGYRRGMGQSSEPEHSPVHRPGKFTDATGTSSDHLQYHLVGQLYQALWLDDTMDAEQRTAHTQAASEMLRGIAPGSALEGMLAVQLVATHHAAMACLDRSARTIQSAANRDMYLRHATKLLRLGLHQVSTLDRCALTHPRPADGTPEPHL